MYVCMYVYNKYMKMIYLLSSVTLSVSCSKRAIYSTTRLWGALLCWARQGHHVLSNSFLNSRVPAQPRLSATTF